MSDFVLDSNDTDKHASALVAPLNINKSPKRSRSREQRLSRRSSSRAQSQSQISPPLTPRSSRERIERAVPSLPVFHNYLRAFYHFHPSSTVSSSTDESSITVPISQGDVILVHSVHPNGWADGTLLASGARGWLPTNYCEAYDHPSIRTLLNALTNLWDLVRDGENGHLLVFTKQDYVRGMIGGVRFFLDKTQCLTRDSDLIVAHVGLRRMRKGLLGDLSSLVKTAKRLQDVLQSNEEPVPVFDHLDELILKGFKLVTRAVRFLDIWAQDAVSLSFDLGDASNNRPLTPPSDTADSAVQPASLPNHINTDVAQATEDASPVSQTNTTPAHDEQDTTLSQPARNLARLSVAFSIPSDSETLQSPLFPPGFQSQTKRLSHRLSYTGKSQGVRKENLASERLNIAHDSFLGFIGSFIGLHLQSRSSAELTLTTQQAVVACRQFLAVLEEIWERDSRRSEQLQQARTVMHARLTDLVHATKNMFSDPEADTGEEVVTPDSGKQLVNAATSCVRSAGDCVMKARQVIERIGDFEFEHEQNELSQSIFDHIGQPAEQHSQELDHLAPSEKVEEAEKPLPAPPSEERSMPPPLLISESKPLPEVPQESPIPENRMSLQPASSAVIDSPTVSSFRSSRISLPPLQQVPTPSPAQPNSSDFSPSPASVTQRFFAKSDSVNASVADSNSSYRYSMRGDTGSVISVASTRATTPDHSPAKKRSSQTLVSSFGSSSELRSMTSEDVSAAEEHLLETTHAHELVHNKEGQITGGSLPALIEQLTTHESTPDMVFVSTFFLTFRLFTTPVEFAQCLINRFDYIGDSPSIGLPVRLRVYNIFKGWLESHWVAESDSAALGVIFSFATGKLRSAIPHAGKRLAELTSKITEIRAGSLVPRMASSLSKTSVFTTADSNVPTPIVRRSQLNLLKACNEGRGQCTILDFDAQELARQLTIIVSKLFCSIQPEELLAQEWQKKSGSKAVNVRAMTALSNDLANLVSDSILHLEEPKKRSEMIKQWVKIGMFCLELHNYDSLMAIVCSLNSSMVQRLKKTWELVTRNTKIRFEELKNITEVGRNYTVLRQRLQTVMDSCVPFVGFYLTDLTFIDEGNSTTRLLHGESGADNASVINFDKYMKSARIIDQIQSFQKPYRLAAVPEMQEWMESQIDRMRKSDQANVQSYYRRSLLLEPRETPQVVRAAPPAIIEDSNRSVLTAESRNFSKEKFEFLNFHFSGNPAK
ncbi:ras guanine-nucleotide exchange protein Cdc25p [Periconia macrospinosa]|uniref:Ras guanine-nucleotide exchange protein Cdc25p n=1 Tax=Periconia macrospinosa TaxID=97972 RepID=A0A2V1EEQ1_9PLEO|nr:ras guanine-nucleotide exchange protein Cdc25p [Periconia macrospinosa]